MATGADTDIVHELPAIFQEAEDGQPVVALLSILAETVADIELHTDPDMGPSYFDPVLCRLPADPGLEDKWLGWLASWVCLPADQDWSAAPRPLDDAAADHRRRRLIDQAAQLYQLRGSPPGLKSALKAFYNIKVEIVEWAWPQGLEIETASTIGVDTFVLDPPDMDRAFTLILDVSDFDLGSGSIHWLDTPLLASEETRVWTPLLSAEEPTTQAGGSGFLDKIIATIDADKPVHTACYVAFKTSWAPPEEEDDWSPLVIGEESTIGMFIMDAESES